MEASRARPRLPDPARRSRAGRPRRSRARSRTLRSTRRSTTRREPSRSSRRSTSARCRSTESSRCARNHRAALPLLAPSFSRLRVSADVVICSSSGWAHGTQVEGRKIVYCHTPARWLYQPDRYLRGRGRAMQRGRPCCSGRRSSGGTSRPPGRRTSISRTRPLSPSGSNRSTASTPRSCRRRRP